MLKLSRYSSETATPDASCDAVVVGAGPAGAVAARQLALLGHRVLLVEKKPFPRSKVCGGCLNARAISALTCAGLAHVSRQISAAPLNQAEIKTRGKAARFALPASVAISRAALDDFLVREAIAAGVTFLPQTTAHVGKVASKSREVHLQGDTFDRHVTAKVVIAADGLQHASVASLPAFASRIDQRSRIGLGATFADDTYDLPPHTVRLCVARDGYVGIVRVEGRMLNVAAAISPTLLRKGDTPDQAVASILAETRTPLPRLAPAKGWHGTPPLTRSTQHLADERLFLIGDATGYVEPFTGEGMSWALESALQAAPLADACIRASALPAVLATRWQAAQRSRMRNRQATCRWLAWVLRSPTRVHMSLGIAQMFPLVANYVVGKMNRPLDVPAGEQPDSCTLPCPR